MPPTPSAPLRLRPYQETGRDFLLARRFALLGDEMGLGKTPQSLAACAALLAADPTARVVFVAPAATLPGLAREVVRWTGETPATLTAKPAPLPSGPRVLLVAWTSLAKRLPDLTSGPRFAVVVLDECHKAKNPVAACTKAALGAWRKADGAWVRSPSLVAHADRVWAMTGTPVPNRPIEIQPLLQMAGGLRWASRAAFGDRYCRQVNKWAPQGFDYLGAHHLPELNARLRAEGVLLRRLAEDVPGELPTLSVSLVPLSGVKDPAESLGLDCDAIRAACGEGSTLPFDELAAYRAAMGEAKAPAVAAWVAEWLEANEDGALVVFVWHREVAQAIAAALGEDEKGVPLAFVATGDDKPAARQEMVDAFALGYRRVFIGSIAACGTGLNGLHKRTTVCAFGEVAWTPGELTQAIGRVRRFGSVAEHAQAHILVGADSLEDHILQTIAGKLDTSAAILGDTVAKGSTAATVAAPSAAIAAPAPVAVLVEPAPVEPTPEPTARAWSWAKLRDGTWGLRADHEGTAAWTGAEVQVVKRDGTKVLAQVGERVACGAGWSVYRLGELRSPTREREYFRRRSINRGHADAHASDPLTDAERAAAVVLSAAAVRLTQADPDRAAVRNAEGWSAADGMVGAALAAVPAHTWDRGTLAGARALLARYARTQAPEVTPHLSNPQE